VLLVATPIVAYRLLRRSHHGRWWFLWTAARVTPKTFDVALRKFCQRTSWDEAELRALMIHDGILRATTVA
jgi:hypothetical protein